MSPTWRWPSASPCSIRCRESWREAFWPGPLTLVLPLRAGQRHSSAGHGRAGYDRAAHAEGLWRASSSPGSAARWPHPAPIRPAGSAPTTAQAVAADLGGRIRLVVDGGATPVGLELTIVKVEDGSVAAAAAGRRRRRGDRSGHRHGAAARRRRPASRRRACWPRTMRRAPRCGSMPTAVARGRGAAGFRPAPAPRAGTMRSPSSTCPSPATCARRQAIFSPICRNSTAAARDHRRRADPARRARRGDQRPAVARRRPA